MKKIIFLFIMLLMPFGVLAYSKYVIPGGETLGIEINSDGILVIGFYKIKGSYNKGTEPIKIGDYIIKINDQKVKTIKNLTKEIEKNIANEKVKITLKRNNQEIETTLNLIEENGVFKTGLYVKDSITGIGTLTYIDPETKIYGALGHEIIESNTNQLVEIKDGSIFKNTIIGIDKSSTGVPGSKNAKFFYDTIFGKINKNTNYGIYGNYTTALPEKELIEVGKSSDIKIGLASIYTVLEDQNIQEYTINITNINETSNTKNITFELIDQELISKTGGIVQGMSGSPIIQNNKLIGAVTHVIIDNPLTGYGLFITTMLEEGEK